MTTQEQIIDHETRLRVIEKICDKIDVKFDRLENKMDAHFMWMLGILFLLIVAIITFIVT